MGLERLSGRNGVITITEDGVTTTFSVRNALNQVKTDAELQAEIITKRGAPLQTKIYLHVNRDGSTRIGWQGTRSDEYGKPFQWQEDAGNPVRER